MSDRGLDVRLVGPVSVRRGGVPVRLPRSRKVLALLALLVLDDAPQSRSHLCDLMWDAANDPKGELRWCLSKLRAIVDDDHHHRLVTHDRAQVAFDGSNAFVDAAEIQRTARAGFGAAPSEQLAELGQLFRGDLLQGVELDGSPALATWLTGQRQRFRTMRVEVTRELAMRSSSSEGEALRRVQAWLQAAPFDRSAHERALSLLLGADRRRDAEEHLAAAISAFEQEGLEWLPLRAWWHETRAKMHAPAHSPLAVALALPGASDAPRPGNSGAAARRRASVAVMPLQETTSGSGEQLAHGMTDDIITRLAKLRALFVIARGSAYALAERGIDAQEAGRILNVEYVTTGRVRRHAGRIAVVVELAETRNARIIWTDELVCDAEGTFGVLDTIVDRIVATIAEEIESAECRHAILKPPSSLDAWEAYHRGLWHMYKFTGPDNLLASRFFQQALALDATFSRAHAGLSFTHFQNVFLELTPDRDRQMDLAFHSAIESLASDDRDPAAHWAMGRALWLRGESSASKAELERSIELSPNFALGHYTLGFVEAQSGDPRLAIEATDTSRRLSPFDPLQFGMLGSRALAHVRLGELEQSVEWAQKAIGRPNAHAHIVAIAVTAMAVTHRADEARKLLARIRARIPSYGFGHFVRAFRFDRDTEQLLRSAWQRVGLSS